MCLPSMCTRESVSCLCIILLGLFIYFLKCQIFGKPLTFSQRCMVESKDGRSRFVPYKTAGVRFSVDAFLLREASNKVSKMPLEETFCFRTTVCKQAYCHDLIISYLDFTSSTCTATCQWATPWSVPCPSPATTTPEQRGLVGEREKI